MPATRVYVKKFVGLDEDDARANMLSWVNMKNDREIRSSREPVCNNNRWIILANVAEKR